MADQNMPNDASRKSSTDQSTRSAGALSAGRRLPGMIRSGDRDAGLVNRKTRDATPRRYEQPIEDD